MKQVTLGDLVKLALSLEKKGLKWAEIENLPIYIGDDEELNGIHTGWFCGLVDKKSKEDIEYVQMIKENSGNIPLKSKAILIS